MRHAYNVGLCRFPCNFIPEIRYSYYPKPTAQFRNVDKENPDWFTLRKLGSSVRTLHESSVDSIIISHESYIASLKCQDTHE